MNEENLPKDDIENAPKDMENTPMDTENTPQDMEDSPKDIESEKRDIEKEWAEELHFDSWPPKTTEETPLVSQTPPPFTGEESQPISPASPAPRPLEAPSPYIAPKTPQATDGQNMANPEPMPNTYLVWSVLATVMCCLIPGIVAIVYSSKVTSRYYAKDYEGAKRASDMAQYWIIGSIVVGIVVQTLYLPLMIAM